MSFAEALGTATQGLVKEAPMKPVLIIKAGSTYPELIEHYGDFEDWIARGLGDRCAVQVCDVREPVPLPSPDRIAAVVITGSHAMVTEQAPWMVRLTDWLDDVITHPAALPVLGICFGHQLLAKLLGGEVGDHPQGMEVGTVALRMASEAARDPLFAGLCEQPWGQMVHQQSVLVAPPEVSVLASNGHDACQAFRYRQRVWGCQFHPEFNADITRAYLQALRGRSISDQRAADAMSEVRECPGANEVLSRFGQLVQDLCAA